MAQRGRNVGVVDADGAEGHVRDDEVEPGGRDVSLLDANARVEGDIRVEVAQDTGADGIELDGGDRGPGPQLGRHGRDEVADAGGGFEDTRLLQAPDAELEDGLPDDGNQVEGRVEGGERGGTQSAGIVGAEEGGVGRVERVAVGRGVVAEEAIEQGRLAEGAVVGQGAALGVGGGTALGLKLVDEFERGEVLLEAVSGTSERQVSGREVKGGRSHGSAPWVNRKPAVAASRRPCGVIPLRIRGWSSGKADSV